MSMRYIFNKYLFCLRDNCCLSYGVTNPFYIIWQACKHGTSCVPPAKKLQKSLPRYIKSTFLQFICPAIFFARCNWIDTTIGSWYQRLLLLTKHGNLRTDHHRARAISNKHALLFCWPCQLWTDTWNPGSLTSNGRINLHWARQKHHQTFILLQTKMDLLAEVSPVFSLCMWIL